MSENNEEDFYKILGVTTAATTADINKAYRDLAMKWHPDKNMDNADAVEYFKEKILPAYETLSDPLKRKNYDINELDLEVSKPKDRVAIANLVYMLMI
jgi:DnaJ-class molecular chaperone